MLPVLLQIGQDIKFQNCSDIQILINHCCDYRSELSNLIWRHKLESFFNCSISQILNNYLS